MSKPTVPAPRPNLETIAQRFLDLALRERPGIGRLGPGPVLAVVRDNSDGSIHVGLNMAPPAGVNATQQSDIIRNRVAAHQAQIAAGRVVLEITDPLGPAGHHAEVNAVDSAIRARERRTGQKVAESQLREFEVHIIWLSGADRARTPAHRCQHCGVLIRGVNVTDSVMRAEVADRVARWENRPVNGLIVPAGGGKPQRSDNAKGTVITKPAPPTPAPPKPAGTRGGSGSGGGGSGILLGVLAIGSTIFMPFINKWIVNTFLKDKVEADARRMIEETLKGNFWKFNVLTTGKVSQIQSAKASGKSPTLFVELIAEWTETRFGWMQTKAWVNNFEVMLSGGSPLQMPLFQPHASWIRGAPSTKLQRHEFSFPL